MKKDEEIFLSEILQIKGKFFKHTIDYIKFCKN